MAPLQRIHLPMQETQETGVRSLGQEGPLEREMATHSNTLAWRIPWTEEPGGLQSKGLQRVGHNLATKQQEVPFYFVLSKKSYFKMVPRLHGFDPEPLRKQGWEAESDTGNSKRCGLIFLTLSEGHRNWQGKFPPFFFFVMVLSYSVGNLKVNIYNTSKTVIQGCQLD